MPVNSPRIEAVLAAFHGEQTDVLSGVVDENVRRGLPDAQTNRIDAALTTQLCVFPERVGLYRIWSPDGEHGEGTEYTVDIKYDEAQTCTCGDFMYRLDVSQGQRCKHLWRAHILLNLGILPPPTIDPYDWLLDELTRDIRLVSAIQSDSNIEETPARDLQSLKATVEDSHRIAINYPSICTQWADILSELYLE